jgi:hypothetical protein
MKQEQVFIKAYEIKPRKCPERKESNKTIIQLTRPWLIRHQKNLQGIIIDMGTVETKSILKTNNKDY